jgi:hypothetical protein
MDPNHVSALAGLVGAAIGGLTSFGTTWVAQRVQLRAQRMETARRQRERLFVEFMNEAARLYADALSHEKDDVADLVKLFAIMAHLRIVSSREVVAAAEHVIEVIIAAYREPNRSLHEIRDLATRGGLESFRELGNAFRNELMEFGVGLSHA